jgi:hypothetical protein
LLFPDGGKKDGKVHFEMGENVFGGEMAEMEYFFLFRQK